MLTDTDLRSFLRRRVRIRWDKEWDRERQKWAGETPKLLSSGPVSIRARLRGGPRISSPERLEAHAGRPTNHPRTQSTGRQGHDPSTRGSPSVFPGGLGERALRISALANIEDLGLKARRLFFVTWNCSTV